MQILGFRFRGNDECCFTGHLLYAPGRTPLRQDGLGLVPRFPGDESLGYFRPPLIGSVNIHHPICDDAMSLHL